MPTFRPTASGPLVAFLALTFLSQYIPGSHAQSTLPACASPCATTAIATAGCSSADIACICGSDPFIVSFTVCIRQSCSSEDIQSTLTFYSVACVGGPGFSVPATSSTSTTGSGTPSSTVLTFPSTVLTSTTTSSLSSTTTSTTSSTSTTTSSETTSTNTNTTTTTRTSGTPSSTSSESTRTIGPSPTNAATSLSGHAHAAAALMAGGIGALVAVAV